MTRFLITMTFVIVAFQLFQCTKEPDPLFTSIPPDESGIHFVNSIIKTDTLTVLDFENIYNGGGVGIGDINNDGLQDIYFTANMTSSKLYLNKGLMRFEDITESAGVATDVWANGVTMVDINQDGYKDIYICVGGTRNTPASKRKNLLFINNQDNTFTESAEKYGLTGKGYTVQASFFDYDLDGDLDVYLLRNAFVEYSRNRARPKSVNGESNTTDQLFRNNGDHTFTDVSAEAGILIEGFGLGIQTTDINDDQWPDIFVSNDFITNDLLYINNGDGTFTNRAGECMKHQTYNAMGNDIADFNNDGLLDLLEVDMLPPDNKRWKVTISGNNYDVFQNNVLNGYEPQYMRNTLQLNNGNGTFSEIGFLAGIEATDWSWSALFGDYDNDGLKDIFITNGYRHDITNLDFIKFSEHASQMGTPEGNRKEKLDKLYAMPGIKVHNYLFKNQGDLTFTDRSEAWGATEHNYANGAVYADLDNDNDLDLVINNIDAPATLLRNNSSREKPDSATANFLRIKLKGAPQNQEGIGAKVYLKYSGKIQYLYFTPFRGFLSSVEPFLHFGLGNYEQVDSLEVIWPDGKVQLIKNVRANQVVTLDYNQALTTAKAVFVSNKNTDPLFTDVSKEAGLSFRHRESNFIDFTVQPLLPHMHSRSGPGIAVSDVNSDGLEDFFIGGAAGSSGGLFLQQQDGSFKKISHATVDSLIEDMGVLFFDADNDGDQDLYIVSGSTEHGQDDTLLTDQLYLNNGQAQFTRVVDAIPNVGQSGSSVIAADYDRDGDLDLFVGGRIVPGAYPLPASSYILQNISHSGKCEFTDVTEKTAPMLRDLGMVTSALWSDYDNDGWVDLIVTGEFMPIKFYKNDQGKFTDATETTGLSNTYGWWNSLTAGDFDNDGDTDYLAGNLGLNSRYRGSERKPLCIYAKDFDNTGSIDPVMTLYIQGEKQLSHSWDDLVKQMTVIRTRFRTYEPYANATFEKSFLSSELAEAYMVCSQWFKSSYIENLGNGKFAMKALPIEAQFAPIYGIIADDYDEDGNLDVLMTGNSYATETQTGRYDACIGLYLKGDGMGNFSVRHVNETGFSVDGDAKGMARLVMKDRHELILTAINSGTLKAHKSAKIYRYLSPSSLDAYAIVSLANGKKRKHEFYYGSSYLSHSSRTLKIPQGAAATLYNYGVQTSQTYP